jgi:four helix bundle protein
MSTTKTSIEGLRIYQASRALEDSVYELVRALPPAEFYRLGNDLRRSSAAISHYISESHKRYSITAKLENLHLARIEIDQLKKYLSQHADQGYGSTTGLQNACIGLTKQAWGLVKHYQQRRRDQQTAARINAADALVAARGR